MRTFPLAFPDASQPLLDLPAVELAARIREGSLSSRALVELYLERIERYDEGLGAFVHRMAGSALREARRLDRLRDRGVFVGPFHGVPTGVKDLHLTRGAPCRMGSRAYRWLWSPIDDTLVKALRRAGFVLIGKTATSELGLLPIVETAIHPPTRTPWNLEHLAGGSSGGAGAAVAAGLVPIAPGSDGAGSIRIPAALNGLVGHKPSRGLVPDDAARIDAFRMTALGPIARCVDDAAALLDALTAQGPAQPRSFLESSRDTVPPLRIGVMVEPPFGRTDPRIVDRVHRAAEVLRAEGHTLHEIGPAAGSMEEFLPIYQTLFARIPVLFPGQLQPISRWFRDEGRRLPAGLAERNFRELEARALGVLGDLDALLTPTTAILAPRVGSFADLPPRELFDAVAPLGLFTAAMNVSGAPAISVPFGQAEGLPIGVQLVARHGEDALVLALGRVLERAALSASPLTEA